MPVAHARSPRPAAQKKSLRAAEQNRPDVAAARAAWCDSQGALNPARLIFIDETWIATNMIRGYGRSPRGERLVGAVPYGHWKTTIFVAGLRCDGLTAPFVIVDRSTANGSAPMLRRCSHRRRGRRHRDPGQSQLAQGRRRARDRRGARRQAALAAALFRQTSTRSSSSSPSSRHSCARPPPELSRPSGHPSRAAARMKAWTRRPQRSILIRSPAALCSQCHGAQGAAPRALRMRCSW